MAIFAFPIFSSRDQFRTIGAFDGKFSENQKRDTRKKKKRTDEFELGTGSKFFKLTGTGQNDIDQKCNGCNRKKFKTKMEKTIFQGLFFHGAGSRVKGFGRG